MKLGRVFAGAAALWVGFAGAAIAQDEDGEFSYVGASLFGENEVGHEGAIEVALRVTGVAHGGAGGDASGDFSAELDSANGRMCYMLEVDGLDEVTAAHLHQGGDDRNGPPVVTLELLGEDGDDVCVDVDAELLKRIERNPAGFYVNVHTAEFPAGAVRGQLGE